MEFQATITQIHKFGYIDMQGAGIGRLKVALKRRIRNGRRRLLVCLIFIYLIDMSHKQMTEELHSIMLSKAVREEDMWH